MDEKIQSRLHIKHVYQMRISNIVDKFMRENWAFRERLDREGVINSATESMMEKYSLSQFLAIEYSDLRNRIGQRMTTAGLYGLLADLSPEQTRAFDEAVFGN
jgi:hypothetical protein